MTKRLFVVGISGPIAVGKSAVAARLAADAQLAATLGGSIERFDADAVLREARRAPGALATAIASLDPAAQRADGSIDATLLATHAFTHPELLGRLEALQWPIAARAFDAARAAASKRGAALLLVEAIALVRSGLAGACDGLILLDAPSAMRLERFRARGGEGEDFARRDASQRGLADALRGAGAITIDASGTPDETATAAREAILRVCFTGERDADPRD